MLCEVIYTHAHLETYTNEFKGNLLASNTQNKSLVQM